MNTHVLWAVVPCPPPDPSPRDRRRYANDLRITLAYLREALRLRTPEQPVAVALVLSKIDTLFPDAEEAQGVPDRRRAPEDPRAAGPPDRAVVPVSATQSSSP